MSAEDHTKPPMKCMNTIYKYFLKITEIQTVDLPEGFRPLTVQMQGDSPCLWAMVNPFAQGQPVTIEMFGTGWPLSADQRQYLGTVQHDGLVWHFFIRP